MNRPLTTGDELWTDAGARAEVHFGFAALRLDSNTDLALLTMDDSTAQLKLTQGVAHIRVRTMAEAETFEVDTPNASITPWREGEYCIEVHSDSNSTDVIVRAGYAEVTGPRRGFAVLPGQRAHVRGNKRNSYKIYAASEPDEFDVFCRLRDRREERSEWAKYVAAGVIGAYELDDFGLWLTHPVWGAYWIPRFVPAGWEPYRFGHWSWIEPWGWTWIDEAPWGFAPFHYGRWIRLEAGWSWIPGPLDGRPVYAPALVAFVDSSAAVAWFPLGPGEVYVPAYHCSRRYLTNINASGTTLENRAAITDVEMARQSYANRAALSAVSRDVFMTGRPIERLAGEFSNRSAASSRVVGSTAPLAPTRESLAPLANPGVRVPEPPASARREAIVRSTPAPAPVPFDRRRPLFQEHPGRPLDRETVDELRRTDRGARK
jgi:hypothetical protein